MADSQFTSTALGAIRLAQENAARLGHSYVGSEHLLLGLASQEYSPAASALRKAGGGQPEAALGHRPAGGHRCARPDPSPGADPPTAARPSGRRWARAAVWASGRSTPNTCC